MESNDMTISKNTIFYKLNRPINTPSPVSFPSASPTPKLFSTPSKKLPDVSQPWQDVVLEESFHENMMISNNKKLNEDNILHIHDDLYINEQDYLSSIISDNSSLYSRPLSFHSPSPLQNEQIIGSPYTKEDVSDPIIERSTQKRNSVQNIPPTNNTSKFNLFLSKMKKATSGKH